ncbi:MAG: cobalamin B12-binding protein [Pelagibacterales bacterium]|nr:cobalamin B12-binding protein [Pelagibacterales bacterium]OUU62176.1 MAG: hypothetical protein CBC22_05460 [Alphaproteobacteria bacterium TMED62]|tara:strand:- start:2389 stop:4128 length:1740 start_codon:yes stop_codon:yes gene_type:complete
MLTKNQFYDITLIRPPAVEAFRFATTSITLPLGLAYIASNLKKNNLEVQVIDAVGNDPKNRIGYYKGYLVGESFSQIISKISKLTNYIGITVVFTHEWPLVVKLIELIKIKFPKKKIVIGGEHVSAMPEFCLATSKADFIVMGEGEETIVELLTLRSIKREKLINIKGLGYRIKNKIIINSRRQRRTDLDDISIPDWESFQIKKYHENRFVGGMYSDDITIPILATRGCPYQCTYCSAPNMWLPRWIPRDPLKVVDEMELYKKKFNAKNFPFQDLTAIIKKDWIKTFCEEIIKRKLKITWQLPTGTRSEAIDDEIAHLLKKSGMTSMAYAPESGSEETRKLIKKRMKTENLFHSISSASSAGLNIAVFIVIGFPHDTNKNLKENIKFVKRLANQGVTDLSVGYYMALPGTQLFNSLFDSGKITLNKKYFSHILDSLAIIPSQKYCFNLTKLKLLYYKIYFLYKFYAEKNKSSIFENFRSLIKLFFTKSTHDSKLQTALFNALNSFKDTIRSRKKRWLSKKEEEFLFKEWDNIYRNIRNKKISSGVIEKSTDQFTDLHKVNVISAIVKDHSTKKQFLISN